jgi:phage terminase small subunit
VRFVGEFLRCGKATEAYVRAGHNAASAQHHAWRLMATPEIRAAIEAGRRRLTRRFDIHPRRVVAEYARIGFASMAHFMEIDEDGSVRLDLSLASRARLAALREIVVEEYCDRPPEDPHRVRRARLKLASKQQALDALARHLGLFDRTASSQPAKPTA